MLAAAAKAFDAVCRALGAETIQGQTALNAVNASKTLVQATNLNVEAVFSNLPPEIQPTVRTYFS